MKSINFTFVLPAVPYGLHRRVEVTCSPHMQQPRLALTCSTSSSALLAATCGGGGKWESFANRFSALSGQSGMYQAAEGLNQPLHIHTANMQVGLLDENICMFGHHEPCPFSGYGEFTRFVFG